MIAKIYYDLVHIMRFWNSFLKPEGGEPVFLSLREENLCS
jgi:hypothetical protein